MIQRPYPALDLLENPLPDFRPALDLEEWVRETFFEESGHLYNETYHHLLSARVCFVWTNAENQRRGRKIIGQCQIMPPMGDQWSAARTEWQLIKWFGEIPTFVITLSAPDCAAMDDTSFCALIEHECHHAGQATDKFGMPLFSKQTGKPVFCTNAHSFEEFVGVVERYGATSPELATAVRHINKGPSISGQRVKFACGSCMRLVK